MKIRTIILLAFILGGLSQFSVGATLSGGERYRSLEEFEQTAQSFQPNVATSEWKFILAAPEIGQEAAEGTGRMVCATKVSYCLRIWSDSETAVEFITADPPTSAVLSEVGVVVVVHKSFAGWSIRDHLKFVAYGIHPSIGCQLATNTDTHETIEAEEVFLTVQIEEGGRGISNMAYQTLKLDGDKLSKVILGSY